MCKYLKVLKFYIKYCTLQWSMSIIQSGAWNVQNDCRDNPGAIGTANRPGVIDQQTGQTELNENIGHVHHLAWETDLLRRHTEITTNRLQKWRAQITRWEKWEKYLFWKTIYYYNITWLVRILTGSTLVWIRLLIHTCYPFL